jgi:hypothetical protein
MSRWGRAAFGALGVVVIMIAVSSCAGSGKDSSSSGNDDQSAPAAAGDPSGQVASLAQVATDRQVISTASMRIEADDVVSAKAAASRMVGEAGGMVFAEETEFGDRAQTVITLKVPPGRFQTALAELSALGRLLDQQVGTEDVTEAVVDLDSRIATARASVERLRGFLAQADSVAEITQVESELVAREGELERLEGQRRALDARVDLATITLTILTPAVVAADELPGFVDGLRGGWQAFVRVGTFAMAAVGALLPFVPFVVLSVVGVRWARRRADHPPSAPPPPAGQHA